jgi:hypothetical protein
MLSHNWLLITKGLHQVALKGLNGFHQVALLDDNCITRWRYTLHQVALEMTRDCPRGRRGLAWAVPLILGIDPRIIGPRLCRSLFFVITGENEQRKKRKCPSSALPVSRQNLTY